MSRVVCQPAISDADLDERLGANDWARIAAHLDGHGWASISNVLEAEQCRTIAGLYDDDGHFRSQVVMARHGFGQGEYRYFSYPLPPLSRSFRSWLIGAPPRKATRGKQGM